MLKVYLLTFEWSLCVPPLVHGRLDWLRDSARSQEIRETMTFLLAGLPRRRTLDYKILPVPKVYVSSIFYQLRMY